MREVRKQEDVKRVPHPVRVFGVKGERHHHDRNRVGGIRGAESQAFGSAPVGRLHAVAVMVMAPAFHTKDLDRVGDTLNIFLFPDLYPSAGS